MELGKIPVCPYPSVNQPYCKTLAKILDVRCVLNNLLANTP